ncbi:microtubule-associated protein futsch [Galendromus occidentalis]|uniref:Microtubule-associated protein futsch n=1 Tax=Galendromus occidentalis TaxID=34638 RepID=A0AAJ6QWF0_9ACAR|nr:microtubule-associated protein futsch [Galendromus occidentalis]
MPPKTSKQKTHKKHYKTPKPAEEETLPGDACGRPADSDSSGKIPTESQRDDSDRENRSPEANALSNIYSTENILAGTRHRSDNTADVSRSISGDRSDSKRENNRSEKHTSQPSKIPTSKTGKSGLGARPVAVGSEASEDEENRQINSISDPRLRSSVSTREETGTEEAETSRFTRSGRSLLKASEYEKRKLEKANRRRANLIRKTELESEVLQKPEHVIKPCRVVVEGFVLSDFLPPVEEPQPVTSPDNDAAGEDVSFETLEIRKKIFEKCIKDSSSSEDEDHRAPCAGKSEKLFDTLLVQTGREPEETANRTSFYEGTIPSRLLSPEVVTSEERGRPAENLTERFEAFKETLSQKAAAGNFKAIAEAEPVVPSFTLEEDATNQTDEVTTGVRRAITLCEEDSDADLDEVMNSKRNRSQGAGNSIIDPVFCDIATSMGNPIEQKDQETLELVIDSSRDPSESRHSQSEEDAVRAFNVRSLGDFVAEDDRGDVIKQARKSKLQSTFLPSPNKFADIAVGTGPSLMAKSQGADFSQDGSTGRDFVSAVAGAGTALGSDTRMGEPDEGKSVHNRTEENIAISPGQKTAPPGAPVEVIEIGDSPPPSPEILPTGKTLPPPESPRADGESERELPVPELEAEIEEHLEEEEVTRVGSTGRKEHDQVEQSFRPENANRPSGSKTVDEDQTHSEPSEEMDHLPLLDLITDIGPWDSFQSSQHLSESPRKKRKVIAEGPAPLLHKETPRGKSIARSLYEIAGNRNDEADSPLPSHKIRKGRVSRRSLFDERAEIPPEILPDTEVSQCFPESSTQERSKSFSLDSARLPNPEETHVEMQFDNRELKKRSEELFFAAAQHLFEKYPGIKGELNQALEELLSTHKDKVQKIMELLVKKYALKEACEGHRESYLNFKLRLKRTRDYITNTVNAMMPKDECNVMKVFGFNPYDFKEPPPDAVREMNMRKAHEDEARLRSRLKTGTH